MTQEEKQLLLIDLCGRLSYGVKVKISDDLLLESEEGIIDGKKTMSDDKFTIKCDKYSWLISCNDFKPYLRPMSSMTEDERFEYDELQHFYTHGLDFNVDEVDWLNKNMFDYRGLIPMGLALEAKDRMYKIK